MNEPAYPAARAVAPKVQAHFARRLAAARERGRDDLPETPEALVVETLIDAAFWASLRREEGVTPTISLASAAQCVYDQRDATAMVASQDGRFTIFKWSPCEEIVHAHRVDALLL